MQFWVALFFVCLVIVALPGLAAPLTQEQVRVAGMTVTLRPAGQTVTIAPLPVQHGECEGKLTLGTPGWRGDFLLPKTAWVYRGLRPGSLVVTRADAPRTRLVEGQDYLLDADWGSVNAAPGSAIPPGTPVHFAYDYTASRLDLVQQTPEGKLVVKQGQEDMSEPLLPEPTPGSRPLFSVYLRHNTRALDARCINFIDPVATGVPPVMGAERLAKTRAKLAAGDGVTMVFFGDSITAQGPEDFRDGKGSFVDRVAAYLEGKGTRVVVTPADAVVAPARGEITVVKAGVGGNDTRDGLARMDRDVLAHHPDLVVVMFGVNDENRVSEAGQRTVQNEVPVAEYRRNLARMVDTSQAAGAEVLLMTTSMKNRGWEGTAGNLDAYAAAAREVAAEKRVCVVDNFRAWQDLPKRGYDPMILLGSCINHPVDLGHEVFFEGVRAALAVGQK